MQLNAAQTVFCTGAANLAAAAIAMEKMGYPRHVIVSILGDAILNVFATVNLREVTDIIEKGFTEVYAPDFDLSGLDQEQIVHINAPGRREEVFSLLQDLKDQLAEVEAAEAASQFGDDGCEPKA